MPKHRFAALSFPVLVDLASGELAYFQGRMTIGALYAGHLQRVVDDLIGPAVQRPLPPELTA